MPRRVVKRHPSTVDYMQYTEEESEYLYAVDRYCTTHGRRILRAIEYLAIAKSLGYCKHPTTAYQCLASKNLNGQSLNGEG